LVLVAANLNIQAVYILRGCDDPVSAPSRDPMPRNGPLILRISDPTLKGLTALIEDTYSHAGLAAAQERKRGGECDGTDELPRKEAAGLVGSLSCPQHAVRLGSLPVRMRLRNVQDMPDVGGFASVS
jgi:hypothetical protein